jgi:ParB family transcriptional regulator, chromosome partitioning protein
MHARLDYVALSDIAYNPAINARRDTETDVSELAATIDTQDIGQPLLLRPSSRGYEPVDGSRRLRALKLLAEQGKIPDDHPVPAYIRELDDAEALSLSLATAITRLDLDPADEALNFADLAGKGMSPDDIAARFGIPLRRVKQRLAIGRLPSEIVEALKAGEIKLADAQAFTLTQDPKQALKLFNKGVCRKWQIEQELTKQRISATSAEAAYVGLDAYKAAGGAVDEDLFSNNAWLADGKLLSKLFQEKIKADEKQWLAEGWGFVMFEMDKPHLHKTGNWPWLKPEGKRNLSKEEKARAEKLRAEIKRLDAAWKDNENPDLEDELADKLDSAKDELEALAGNFFTDAQKKKSGVVVRKEYQKIEVHFGMMKPDAAKKEAKLSKQTARDDDEDDPSPVRKIEPDAEADFTGALQAEMAKAMTHALQRAVMTKPEMALRLAAAALMTLSNFERPEGLVIHAPIRRDADVSRDAALFQEQMMERAGHNPSPLYIVEMFRALEGDISLHDVIARSLAPLVKVVSYEQDDLRPIIDAFDPDVLGSWQPDAEFFKRMPRESLAAALAEAAIPGVTPSKKKKDLVEMAVRDLAPKGWLPKPLRTPSYKGPGSNAWADAQGAKAAGIEAEEESA